MAYFQRDVLHPAIALEVTAEDGFIDVLAAGFDAGVRYEERLEKDMIAIPIGPRVQRYATAAAPAYLAKHGMPRHPRELLDHATIRHRFQSGIALAWEFGEGETAMTVSPPAIVLANSTDLEISAAVDGLGIIRTFEELLIPAINAGRLVPILEAWVTASPARSSIRRPTTHTGTAARLCRFPEGGAEAIATISAKAITCRDCCEKCSRTVPRLVMRYTLFGDVVHVLSPLLRTSGGEGASARGGTFQHAASRPTEA